MLSWWRKPVTLPSATEALPDRSTPLPVAPRHAVLGNPMVPPWPEGHEFAAFGLGCFWGAERVFWRLPGMWTTAVGYAGGHTANARYEDVCSGRTGHAEVVIAVWDPDVVRFATLVARFFEAHDPTQGMRQGNDVGTQYRSALYTTSAAQLATANEVRDRYALALAGRGIGPVTTEIAPLGAWYYAEDDHQQYLHKNPAGYCGLGGTGVACPIG